MQRKCQFWLHFILTISLIITAAVNLNPVYAQDTKICVDPPIIIDETKTVGTTFTINVNVTDVATGIGGFEFKLRFDTTILNATALSTDFFGPEGTGPADQSWVVHKEMNNVLGYVYYAVAMGDSSPYSPNGRFESGVLATIGFVVENVGVTSLDLYDDDLRDPNADPILHGVFDGYFSNTGYANPVADFTFEPQSPILGETVVFNAAYDPVTGGGSYDIDGHIASWNWDFGDGATGNGEIVEHSYTEVKALGSAKYGTTVTLTVTDNSSLTSTATKDVILSGHNIAVINAQPNQTYVMQNQTISINVTIKNKGSYTERLNVTACYNGTPVAPLKTIYVSATKSADVPFTWDTSDLANGPYIISANATHYPESPADVEYIINDNTFNDGTVTVVSTPVHDIVVIEVTPSPSLVFVGDNVNIDVTIANQGFLPETFNASVYYETNLIGTETDVTIPALTSQILTFTWNTAGVHWGTYLMSANVSEVLDEISTINNNLTDGSVGVALHNINVLSLSAPTSTVVGSEAAIEAVLKNEGKQNATFTVFFYYDTTLITEQTVTNLIPSDTKSLTVLWDTASLATGPYTVKVKVPQLEGELVATDNERTQLVSLIPKMMHEITVVSVTTSETEVTVGESVIVTVIVRNEGNFSESFSVTAKYNDHTIETSKNVSNLAKGQTETVTFTWNTTGVSPGTYTIKASASAVLDEEDTTNNIQEDGTVTVNESPGGVPLSIIVAIGVLIIIAVGIAAYYLKRKKP